MTEMGQRATEIECIGPLDRPRRSEVAVRWLPSGGPHGTSALAAIVMVLLLSAAVRGQVSGPESIALLDMPVLAQTDSRPLPVLVDATAALASSCQTCSLSAVQYRIWVPEGSLRLVIELVQAEGTALALAVRKDAPVLEDADYVYFSYASTGQAVQNRLEVPCVGETALASGTYYIAVLNVRPGETIQFELRGALYTSMLPAGVSLEISSPFALAGQSYTDEEKGFSLLFPAGWSVVAPGERHANVLAAFVTPEAIQEQSAGLLEVGGWDMTIPRTPTEVFERLAPAYIATGMFRQIGAPQETTLDGLPAVLAVFSGSPMTTLLTCCVDGLHVWLLSLAFRPAEAVALYEAVFLMAVKSFHRQG